jgi:hypothetical protein
VCVTAGSPIHARTEPSAITSASAWHATAARTSAHSGRRACRESVSRRRVGIATGRAAEKRRHVLMAASPRCRAPLSSLGAQTLCKRRARCAPATRGAATISGACCLPGTLMEAEAQPI